MREETPERRAWSLNDPEVQAAKARFVRNRHCHPRPAECRDIKFDDLFRYFITPHHLGVRHKARLLRISQAALLLLYDRYLREFCGKLNRNAGSPRRKKKSAA